jgi:PAS domain-containing protein
LKENFINNFIRVLQRSSLNIRVTSEFGPNPYRGFAVLCGVVLITKQSRGQTFRTSGEFCFLLEWKVTFESSPTMYFIVDEAGGIISANAHGAEQPGYTVTELVGRPVLNVFYEPIDSLSRDMLMLVSSSLAG